MRQGVWQPREGEGERKTRLLGRMLPPLSSAHRYAARYCLVCVPPISLPPLPPLSLLHCLSLALVVWA